jgi:V/A-type H+-transporting ATPase subunit C
MLKLEEPKKLKLGTYPYTYVRTAVMKSLLFRKDDYHKMLKMGFSEIAKFLQESHYRKEINELANEHSGADLIELALNKSLAESFKKLLRISPDELSLLIREYVKRKDIEDIKTIIRGRFTGTDKKLVAGSLTGAGTLSMEFLMSLLEKESVEEILKGSRIADFHIFKDSITDFNEKNSLASIENALDKFYYSHIIQFSGILPKEGRLFKNFLLKEAEIMNILTLLRLNKAGLGRESALNFVIPLGDRQKDAKMALLANANDIDEMAKVLQRTEFTDIFSEGIEEFRKSNSLIALETGLHKHLLRQSVLLMHQHPLSVDIILGYMFAKDIEVRNLKIILKGKQLGLSEGFIESQLVF